MSKYDEFKNTELWSIIERLVSDLERNQDIQITTKSDYVTGYFCEKLSERVEIKENNSKRKEQ